MISRTEEYIDEFLVGEGKSREPVVEAERAESALCACLAMYVFSGNTLNRAVRSDGPMQDRRDRQAAGERRRPDAQLICIPHAKG
ncbi:MAG: hypothetical protein ACLR4Z_17070 [Butyricicoccaceae bacterium]